MKRNFILLATGLLAASSALAADVKFNGDFRFRYEGISDNPVTSANAVSTSDIGALQHERISLRFGSIVQVSPVSLIEFRLATGAGVNSSWWTLGKDNGAPYAAASLQNFPVSIDRAYFAYTGVDHLTLVGGRMKNVFYMAGGSDMLVSSDLNFDGMGGAFTYPVGTFNLFLNAGHVWVAKDETTVGGTDNTLVAVQAGARHKLDNMDYGFGIAAYNVAAPISSVAYNLMNIGFDINLGMLPVNTAIFADYVTNGGAANKTDGDKHNGGYLVGAKFGATKKAGDWMVSYDYRNVKAQATLQSIQSSDSINGANLDGKVHRVKLSYVLADNTTLTAAGYLATATNIVAAGGTTTDYVKNRFQLQADFTF